MRLHKFRMLYRFGHAACASILGTPISQ